MTVMWRFYVRISMRSLSWQSSDRRRSGEHSRIFIRSLISKEKERFKASFYTWCFAVSRHNFAASFRRHITKIFVFISRKIVGVFWLFIGELWSLGFWQYVRQEEHRYKQGQRLGWPFFSIILWGSVAKLFFWKCAFTIRNDSVYLDWSVHKDFWYTDNSARWKFFIKVAC